MIADTLLIFIILFVLIYCMEDSFFGLFVLFVLSVIQEISVATSVSAEADATTLVLYSILVLYSLGSLIQWTITNRKNKEAS